MVITQILIATVIISLIAFVGIFTFLLKKELLNRTLMVLVALSTGALLGGAFLRPAMHEVTAAVAFGEVAAVLFRINAASDSGSDGSQSDRQ